MLSQQGRVSPRTSSQHSGDKQSQASSPRASMGDRMTTQASQGSPAHRQNQSPMHSGLTPTNRQNGSEIDNSVKVEMPTSITGTASAGPAAVGERTMPQTIQEGIEPDEEDM